MLRVLRAELFCFLADDLAVVVVVIPRTRNADHRRRQTSSHTSGLVRTCHASCAPCRTFLLLGGRSSWCSCGDTENQKRGPPPPTNVVTYFRIGSDLPCFVCSVPNFSASWRTICSTCCAV